MTLTNGSTSNFDIEYTDAQALDLLLQKAGTKDIISVQIETTYTATPESAIHCARHARSAAVHALALGSRNELYVLACACVNGPGHGLFSGKAWIVAVVEQNHIGVRERVRIQRAVSADIDAENVSVKINGQSYSRLALKRVQIDLLSKNSSWRTEGDRAAVAAAENLRDWFPVQWLRVRAACANSRASLLRMTAIAEKL